MGATFANKMPKLYKLSAVVRIFILLALCGLSNAQVLYVDDFCDFAGYDGICLEASKCTDLQAKMQAMTLESHHVGRCSFGVREEIICCPKWQTPVQTPPKLPNAFIDLSKQPEFQHKSPPDGAFSDSSIPITTSAPINFPQNGLFVANPLPNVQDNQNINGNPVVDENERMNAIFGVNPEQIGNDKDEKKANSLPVVNENNNGFFISNPLLNVQANQNLNGNPALDERINAIFGVNPEQIGNNKDEKKAISLPVVNENNNGFFISNPVLNVQANQNLNGNPALDKNERITAIFGVNPEQIGNDNNEVEKKGNSFPVVNENNNGIFIANSLPNVKGNQNLNGNPALDKNERINAIFGVNPEQNGNDNNKDEKKVNSFPVVNENNNGIFIANPLLNVLDNQLIGYPVIDENDRLNAIFGVNPEQIGNDNNVVEKKGNSFPVVNENNNGFFATNPVLNVQANQNFNDNPVINENDRFNAIFGGNREEAGSDKIQEERKGNPVPVINGNNGIISANPVPSVQNSLKLNGNPVIDENRRLNAIFGNNLEHNSNDESKERNPAPFVNGNNNGFFSATPVPNVQGNGQFIGSPVIDVNERVKAIFGDNPVQVESDNSKDESKGNIAPLVNDNNNGIFNKNPIPNVEGNQSFNGNPVVDENERFNALFNGNPLPIADDRLSGDQNSAEKLKAKFNAIFGGNREEVGNDNDKEESKGNPVPVIDGNNNGIFNQNPIPNVENNQKLNGNPFFDENERFNSLFNGNPSQSGSVSSTEKLKGNSLPVIAENNNGFFNENPVSKIQSNQKSNGNPFFDENERFNAIFNGNPIPKENHIGGLNGVISQNPANFGGQSVQLGDISNSRVWKRKPIPGDDELVQNNAAMDGKGIPDEKALINAILNGQLESSPEHFIFNDKTLWERPLNRRRHGSFMENRSTFNNGHFNMRNHRRSEERTHRRNQGVYSGTSRNTRIRFANN